VLHDVVEDTNVTLGALEERGFGRPILDTLGSLSHRPGEPYEDDIHRLAVIPMDAVLATAAGLGPRSPEAQAISSRTARTWSMVVRGLTKHSRATFSPIHVVGWTKPTWASSVRRHQFS
jgi:hypothetical protein